MEVRKVAIGINHKCGFLSTSGQITNPVAWAAIAMRSIITLMKRCDSLLFRERSPAINQVKMLINL